MADRAYRMGDLAAADGYDDPSLDFFSQLAVKQAQEPSRKYASPIAPDLQQRAGGGEMDVPQGYAVNDAGEIFNTQTGEVLPVTRRPGVLPLTRDAVTGDPRLAMPVVGDLAGYMLGGVGGVGAGGGTVLGAGPARGMFNKLGIPRESAEYSKMSRATLDEIAVGPKGAGPMDLSVTPKIDVPQFPIERFVPPRGVSARLQDALANPNVSEGVASSIDTGIGMGADKWYHTGPVLQSFVDTLGPVEGPARFRTYMDMVAATSPRSDVPTNIRNASYYYMRDVNDQGLPRELPYPYGHIAQNLHRENFDTITAPAPSSLSAAANPTGNWDIFKNPKPASFSQNLQGNLEPGTMDTHAFRNIGMRTEDPRFLATSLSGVYKEGKDPATDSLVALYGEVKKNKKGELINTFRPQQLYKSGKLSVDDALNIPSFWASKPRENEYGAAERFYRSLGEQRGLPTADAQAAAWAGGGKLTGLGSPPSHTFPEMMNERVLYTAKMRGEDPQDTLKYFITGKKPLLSIGPSPTAMGSLAAQDQYAD